MRGEDGDVVDGRRRMRWIAGDGAEAGSERFSSEKMGDAKSVINGRVKLGKGSGDGPRSTHTPNTRQRVISTHPTPSLGALAHDSRSTERYRNAVNGRR